MERSDIPFVAFPLMAPSPLLDPLCLAALNTDSPDEKAAARKEVVEGSLKTKLAAVIKLLSKAGGHFLTGPNVTYADFVLFKAICGIASGTMDGVPANTMDAYPELKAFHARFAALPAIAKMYEAVEPGPKMAYKQLPCIASRQTPAAGLPPGARICSAVSKTTFRFIGDSRLDKTYTQLSCWYTVQTEPAHTRLPIKSLADLDGTAPPCQHEQPASWLSRLHTRWLAQELRCSLLDLLLAAVIAHAHALMLVAGTRGVAGVARRRRHGGELKGT
eukprot:358814-Chlamydomonas_euryale.AAC.7